MIEILPKEVSRDGLWLRFEVILKLSSGGGAVLLNKNYIASYRPTLDGDFKSNIEDVLVAKMQEDIDTHKSNDTEKKKLRFSRLKAKIEARLRT